MRAGGRRLVLLGDPSLHRGGGGHGTGLGRDDGKELVTDELDELPIVGGQLLLDDPTKRLQRVVGLDLVVRGELAVTGHVAVEGGGVFRFAGHLNSQFASDSGLR